MHQIAVASCRATVGLLSFCPTCPRSTFHKTVQPLPAFLMARLIPGSSSALLQRTYSRSVLRSILVSVCILLYCTAAFSQLAPCPEMPRLSPGRSFGRRGSHPRASARAARSSRFRARPPRRSSGPTSGAGWLRPRKASPCDAEPIATCYQLLTRHDCSRLTSTVLQFQLQFQALLSSVKYQRREFGNVMSIFSHPVIHLHARHAEFWCQHELSMRVNRSGAGEPSQLVFY